jgi:hypothetical protein
VFGLIAIAIIITVFVCAYKTDSRRVSLEASQLNIERGAQRKKLPPRGDGPGS